MKIYLLILFIVIITYYAASWNVSYNEYYLYGFWVADNDEFCTDSEIESMLLYVGESDRKGGKTTRLCYIIIMNNICQQGLTLSYTPSWSNFITGLNSYTINAKVEFDEEDIWPEFVNIDINLLNGSMKIHHDGTIYAKLVKQNETTNRCRNSGESL